MFVLTVVGEYIVFPSLVSPFLGSENFYICSYIQLNAFIWIFTGKTYPIFIQIKNARARLQIIHSKETAKLNGQLSKIRISKWQALTMCNQR